MKTTAILLSLQLLILALPSYSQELDNTISDWSKVQEELAKSFIERSDYKCFPGNHRFEALLSLNDERLYIEMTTQRQLPVPGLRTRERETIGSLRGL